MAASPRQAKHRPEEILSYLDSKGWSSRLEGDNYKIQTCIFCGNTSSNFEVHKDRGMYKSWCCGEMGSFYALKERLGDVALTTRKVSEDDPGITPERMDELTDIANTYHERLWLRPVGLNYLHNRGFNDQTIRHFRFGCQKKDGEYWLTIPHFVGDKCVNIKYRSLPPAKKKWRQEKPSNKVLFNQNCLEHYEEIIVTEGELKSAALFQMGFENTVSLTGGVQTIMPNWVDQMDRVKKIYLCLDSDQAGQKGAEDISMRFGPEKCFNIYLKDAKDPDEWFFTKGHTAEEFEGILRKAKLIDIQNIVSVNKAFALLQEEMEMENVDAYQGLQTPWPEVNKLTRGFKPGEYIVVSAPPKIGKTSLTLDISLYQTSLGNPVLFFCMEMSAKRLARKMASNILSIPDEQLDATSIALAREELRRRPFYLLEGVRRGITVEEVIQAIKASYRRYGLKMVVFDNLHFLVRSPDKLREKIGEVSQEFKLLAEELRIPIMMIVHPRKLNNGRRAMTADDFKESSAMHADADQIIILHRDRKRAEEMQDEISPDTDKDNILSPITDVIIDASRFSEGGKVQLYFDGAKSKYTSINKGATL